MKVSAQRRLARLATGSCRNADCDAGGGTSGFVVVFAIQIFSALPASNGLQLEKVKGNTISEEEKKKYHQTRAAAGGITATSQLFIQNPAGFWPLRLAELSSVSFQIRVERI